MNDFEAFLLSLFLCTPPEVLNSYSVRLPPLHREQVSKHKGSIGFKSFCTFHDPECLLHRVRELTRESVMLEYRNADWRLHHIYEPDVTSSQGKWGERTFRLFSLASLCKKLSFRFGGHLSRCSTVPYPCKVPGNHHIGEDSKGDFVCAHFSLCKPLSLSLSLSQFVSFLRFRFLQY